MPSWVLPICEPAPPSIYYECIESLSSQSHCRGVNSSSQVELCRLSSSVIHLALKQFIMWNLKTHTYIALLRFLQIVTSLLYLNNKQTNKDSQYLAKILCPGEAIHWHDLIAFWNHGKEIACSFFPTLLSYYSSKIITKIHFRRKATMFITLLLHICIMSGLYIWGQRI